MSRLTSLADDLRYALRRLARDPGLAAVALEETGILNQAVASIAKREEWIYVLGQEDEPVKLDRFSQVLHLVQSVRDEAHRIAITFHHARREKVMLGKRDENAGRPSASGRE